MVASRKCNPVTAKRDQPAIVLPLRPHRAGPGPQAKSQRTDPGDAAGPPAQSRSIGRELPLARLLDNLKSALSGTGRTCLIAGEAGVGKTRLMQELLDRARVHDCLVLSGKAQDYDDGIAYASLRDLLASVPAGDVDEASRVILADLLQALDAAVLGRRPGPEPGAGHQPAYLLATRFFSSLCQHRPVIIALDDAHLADDESLTALSLAARYLAQLPLFLVVSTRLDKWVPGSRFAATIGRLIDSGLGAVIDLSPLDSEDTTALIAADLSGRADERLAAYVYAQSRGNPLFTRQALRSLRELGAIRAEHGVWYLVGNRGTGSLSRRAALLHRVFQQDRPGRELARVMSAFRRVHLDHLSALEAVTDMSRDAIEAAFDALTRAGIITRVSMGWYEFAHPLIAEVLYNDLGPLERRRLHKLIAESFNDRQPAAGVDILEWTTHVAEAATPGDPAAIAAVLKAAQLTRNTAPLSAATWYARALDLLPAGAPERGELLSRQAIALWKGSRPEAAVEVGSRALAAQGSGDLRTRTLTTVINALYAMGRYNDALAFVSEQVSSVADPAPFLAQQALLLAHMGRCAEAVRQLDQAQARAEGGSAAEQVVTYSFVGHVSNCLGDFARASVAADRLSELGLGERPGLAPGARLSALESAVYLLASTGCLPQARALMAKVTGLLPETGWQDVGGRTIYAKAKIEVMTGAWADALETIRSGAISLEFAGLRNNLAWLRLLEAEILTDQAQLDEAARVLETTLLPPECTLYSVMHECRVARVAMALGDYGEAERMLLAQAGVARDGGMATALRWCLVALVELSLAAGDHNAAARYAGQLRDLAVRTGVPATAAAADLVGVCLGDVAAGERLVAEYEAEGRLFFAAQAHFHLAAFVPEPDEHLSRAIELFTSMDAQLWTHRAASRAKLLGLTVSPGRRRPRSRAAGPEALTETEVQLVQLLRQGLTNRQISAVMHYSAKTIEVYLSRLYQKVGYHSRLELVLAAERGELGVLPPEDRMPGRQFARPD
jgi:DNA-binding CsgD family transcriptional regulator/tetratricopeptide (TPR) repeat protein